MKKNLLLLFSLSISIFTSFAQSSNTCAEANAATAITAGSYTVSAINGTDVPDERCDGLSGSGPDNVEWFRYVPDADYSLVITSDLVVNGDKNTKVNIYSGDCSNLVCEIGDDNSGTLLGSNGLSFLSYAVTNVTAGNTYYIVWDNKQDSSGFEFQLIENSPLPAPAGDGPIAFTIESAGIDGTYDRGMVDLNGDFLDDLVAIDADVIYTSLQNADGSRSPINKVTPFADFVPTWSMSVGDYNADGFNDLMYGNGAGVTFMRSNQTGNSGFDSVMYEEFSTTVFIFSQRTNFIDINNDGLLDAFASHDSSESVAFINDGNNNLDYTTDYNLGDYPSGGNYASIWIDFDNDRDLDMFMAKCSGASDPERPKNELYMNNGDGTFTEISASAGLDDIIQTWSAAWGDYDNDGDMDIYVGGNDEIDHKLMRNNGDRTFTDVTPGSGIGTARKGKENIAGDFNNDGFLDVATNGMFLYGNGDLTFREDFPGFPNFIAKGSIGDINNDGFLDLFEGSVYINGGNSNNWLKVITIGDQAGGNSNINGIGARVEINSALGTQIRDIHSGVGFKHMNSLNTHFGIGADTVINYLRIYWPSGVVDNILNPDINQAITVVEGSTLGTDDLTLNDPKIYPVPTLDILNVELPNEQNNFDFAVFDITGKKVLEQKSVSARINVSALSTGTYILKIITDKVVYTDKFIKR